MGLLFPFFDFGGIFLASILLVNAIAVLSEDRFLARIGWGSMPVDPGFGTAQDQGSVKQRIVTVISSVRTVMRLPLIVINTVVVVYLLILG